MLERAGRELAHALRLQNAINHNVVFLFEPNDLLFLASCYTPNTDIDLSFHSAIESSCILAAIIQAWIHVTLELKK